MSGKSRSVVRVVQWSESFRGGQWYVMQSRSLVRIVQGADSFRGQSRSGVRVAQ